MNKIIVLVTLVITLSSITSAIEVGGHISDDTIWSPDNNPYLVTETIYIDFGVTLYILPGTEIKISGARLAQGSDYTNNFWLDGNGWSLAKYIKVDGRIIAEGTEEDKIVFTRLQENLNYNWGSISVSENADLCVFKYCIFEHMGNTGLAASNISEGIDFYNGKGIVRNCYFLNCTYSVSSNSPILSKIEITNNSFIIDNNVNPYLLNFNSGKKFIHCGGTLIPDSKDVLVCNNFFDGAEEYGSIGGLNISIAYNQFNNCLSSGGGRCYYFKNEFNNCNTSISAANPLYSKYNSFIGGTDAINIDHSYAEISNNYFEDCTIELEFCNGNISSNLSSNCRYFVPGEIELYNNIFYNNSSSYGLQTGYNPICSNNIIISNRYAIWSASNQYYNSIFLFNDELTQHTINGYPVFRNCILDFPLNPPLIDVGGNTIIDSLQAQEIFVDIENGSFHLATNSIAIDAGFDTLGYYYPFDLDNSVRIWDGDGDGNAIIDIGAYEYGAPQLGEISGYITETFSGEPVDYVLLKANNELGEFTFADSSGYFEIQLPEGTYDLYAERVFYEDNIIYTVTVENELTTEIEFNMTYNDPLVGVNDNEINVNSFELNASNYPNPFNPSTTISFNLPTNSNVSVEVYNVKGQKVRTLLHEKMPQGQHEVVWYGLNEKNKPISSGVYFYKVRTGKQESVKRMILLK